jgi:hypothetical protein
MIGPSRETGHSGHSITRSTRRMRVGGSVRRRTLAVLTLSVSSGRVGIVYRKTMLDGLPVLMIWPVGVSLPLPGSTRNATIVSLSMFAA